MLIFYNVNWVLHWCDFKYLNIHHCGDFRLKILMVKKLLEMFYKKELQKTDQSQFRVE